MVFIRILVNNDLHIFCSVLMQTGANNDITCDSSHAAMITQCYEQFWYKPIPHDFEKLMLNQWS